MALAEIAADELEAKKTTYLVSFKTAFRAISSYFERPNSDTVLFSGVADDDLITPTDDTLQSLSRRIGLECSNKSVEQLLSGNVDLPGVLRLENNSFIAILNETENGSFLCFTEEAARVPVHLSRDKLSQLKGAEFYSFSKTYLNNREHSQVGHIAPIEKKHWFFSSISSFWRSYALVAVAALTINMLALASPLFVMNVYDRVLPNKAISTLWVLAAGVFLALLFDFALKMARASLIDYSGRKVDLRLSQLLFEKILSSTMSSRPFSTGEYANRVSQYEFVREFFSSNTIATFIDTFFVFIFLSVIWIIGGWLFLIPTSAFLLVVVIGFVAQYRISKRIASAANEAAQRQSLLVEVISIAETVKYLRAEGGLLKRWRELSVNSTRTQEEIKQISAGASNATAFVQQLVTVGIVLSGAYLFQAAEVTTGAIIASVILSGRAVAPLGQLTMTLARFRQVLLSLKILNQIMSQPEDGPSAVGFVNRVVDRGEVTFDDLTFKYEGSDQNALDGLNLKIGKGERVGIIGKIGSGKTTIGRLLGALYTPSEGRVLFDGVDSRQYHPAEIRAAVAVAGQSSDLFSGTVKENLQIAKPTATDEELLMAARLSGVEAFVTSHPRGFDMQVGENGSNLSSGQKQALTIARLLLMKPKIVFLDEPSGAMDLASERQLIKNLSTAFDDDTTIIISTHRYSMLELVDRLVVLDNGKVVANGPKEDVIKALQNKATGASA
ncbi:MAG: type I secretion system permease/ATPase [Hyphomicrobiales bacterium]